MEVLKISEQDNVDEYRLFHGSIEASEAGKDIKERKKSWALPLVYFLISENIQNILEAVMANT